MIKTDETSNAQCWELEVTCKNVKYRDAVIKAALSLGHVDIETDSVECTHNYPKWEGKYTVLMWSSGFNNLAYLSKKLKKLEDKFENV